MNRHPEFAAAGGFGHLPLGKLKAKRDKRTLKLADYLDDEVVLPQLPDSCDRTKDVVSWPMYGNNAYGDCTCAAAGHMAQAWTAGAGTERDPSDDDVLNLYWLTGDPPNTPSQPGGATDTGRFEIDVLNAWRQTGLGPDKIDAYVAVDPTNVEHVKAAIFLFGGVYTGIALPKTAQSQAVWDVVGDGKTGDGKPGSWGGHAVPYLAYAAAQQAAADDDYYWHGPRHVKQADPAVTLFTCVTWGAPLTLTEAFHAAYCDELYAIVSRDFLTAQGTTADGFDLDALMKDLAAITSK